MMNQLANSDLVDEAFNWLCQQLKHVPVNSDVWDVQFHWNEVKTTLIAELTSNSNNMKPIGLGVNMHYSYNVYHMGHYLLAILREAPASEYLS